MRRKLYDRLKAWKEQSRGESALMIDGARRVGKSYLVEEFAKREYKSYILIDFNRVSEEVKGLFDQYLDHLDMFFLYLSNYAQTPLYERESLIIFDEVQLYPRARAAIKYLVADRRYDYIETGSLVSIKRNVADIVIPSEEEQVKLHPIDFEEFLWAMGNEMLMPFIRDCFEVKRPLGQVMHRQAMDYFRQYMIVGGMPQAVAKYLETKSFADVDRVKRRILDLYRADIRKYAGLHSARVSSVFDQIPAQLQRHERRFTLSDLEEGARQRDYEAALFWLDEAMVVNMCYNATEPSVGLMLNQDRTTLKIYMADTGLLLSQSFGSEELVDEEIYKKILLDKLSFNKGMVVENIVAQMLRSAGHSLFFYSNPTRESAEDRMEIDFLITKSGVTSRHNISPIEVKSGQRYTLTSLRKCIKKYDRDLATPYVIHPADLRISEEGITFLPLYMTPLL
ncbi:ATP-binding protein [uncultured Porphyromonas sp.]|uniref:ATP-binding protein n=1 Tax=uncultured Porphyromonas sp. TaxID=159274 RepID=UPI0025EC55D3|nr:ATP-binding protein [uncultured Porphyromonas sp.]